MIVSLIATQGGFDGALFRLAVDRGVAPCCAAGRCRSSSALRGISLSVDVHAFASQGFILTGNNNYLADKTTQGSFQFSEVGLNFTKTLTDKFRMGVQLFAQDLGPTGNYDAKMDWFYLDYRWQDWLGFRVGRVKIPFGLYNEINDIDAARLPILLPQGVYPINNRNYLLAQTGGELYGYARLHLAGALDYHGYAGTIFLDATNTPGSPIQITGLDVKYVVGGRLMWETPLEGLRLGGSLQQLRLDITVSTPVGTTSVDAPVTLGVASVEYAAHDVLVAAEFSRWAFSLKSGNTSVYPSIPTTISDRAYLMTAYRPARWFQFGAYYSLLVGNDSLAMTRANEQHDFAGTVRFDINDNWLVKLEGHYMVGTAALDSTLNGNVPLSQLDKAWGAFLAKTTAYF